MLRRYLFMDTAKILRCLTYVISTTLILTNSFASYTDREALLPAAASGHPRSAAVAYGAVAPIIDDADEILRKFDCTGSEGGFADFRAGIQRLREYEILKLGHPHLGARMSLYNEMVKPFFVRSYQEHKNPAAAYYLTLHTDDLHEYQCAITVGSPAVVYYLVGSIVCGWFYPRFAPTYRLIEDALEIVELAQSKCIDRELKAKIEMKAKDYKRNLTFLRWTFRTIALGAVAGGVTAAVKVTGKH